MESRFFRTAFHDFADYNFAFQPADVRILRNITTYPFKIDWWKRYFHRSGQ